VRAPAQRGPDPASRCPRQTREGAPSCPTGSCSAPPKEKPRASSHGAQPGLQHAGSVAQAGRIGAAWSTPCQRTQWVTSGGATPRGQWAPASRARSLRRPREHRDLPAPGTGDGTRHPGSRPRAAPRHPGMHRTPLPAARRAPGIALTLRCPRRPAWLWRAPARSTAPQDQPPAKEVPKITRRPQLLFSPRQLRY